MCPLRALAGRPRPRSERQSLEEELAEHACLAAARNTRNAVILRGEPAYEVFACMLVGADPARARFE